MLVSVIMAVYNGEKFIQEAIDSILLQTYKNYELIIVNDASTDNTTELLNQIADPRVRIIHLSSNQGAAEALNIGIEQAKGDWIAIHDSDDISVPTRLEIQVRYILEQPNLVAVGSWIKCIPGDDQVQEVHLRNFENTRNGIKTCFEITSILYQGCPLTHGSVMFSKSAFMKVGKYDANLRIAHDYDLWTRLITVGQIENVPEILYYYRIYKESLSNKNIQETVKELFYSFSKYIKNSTHSAHDNDPKFVVMGSKRECELFVESSKSSLVIPFMINKKEKSYLLKLCSWFRSGKIDGVILLDSTSHKKLLIHYLEECGMVRNQHIFEFWSGNL